MKFVKTVQFQSADKNSVHFLLDDKSFLKISILEDKIFRVSLLNEAGWNLGQTWSIAPGLPGLPVEGRDRDSLEGFRCPPFQIEHGKAITEISSKALLLRVEHNPLRLRWFDLATKLEIHSDRKELAYARKDSRIWHYSQRDLDGIYFGLGEKTGSLVRTERRFQMGNIDAMDYDPDLTDPLYKHIPFYLCQRKGTAYGIFYDNLSDSIFDFGSERENYFGFYTSYQASQGDLDYYFILGPQLKNVTEQFSWLTGKTCFLPKNSIRYSGSTMAYTEGPRSQEKIHQFIDKCKSHQIPVGSFQLSSGYCLHGKLRHVFVWNKEKFPDFLKLAKFAQNQEIDFSANIKPVLFEGHPDYQKKLLIQASGTPEKSYFWDGFASHLDFSQEATRIWWKEKIKTELLNKGVVSTWNDNNEFHIIDEKAELTGFAKPISVSQVKPVLSLLMCQSSYQAHLEFKPERRPWLITRAGGPGMQRYAQTWTGDNRSSWRSLKMNLQTGLGLSLSGIYNWGIDVGGFSGPTPEPLLFLRWVQQGIFYPRFTIHSWKEDGTATEPWMYPEILPLIKTAMDLRESLLPYIYNLFYQAHQNFSPVCRPLAWEAVNEQTLKYCDQFYLGDRLLICPITEKTDELEIYFPACKQGWWDYSTRKWYAGDQVLKFPVQAESIFLFVKGNSAIPIQKSGETILEFFPSPEPVTEAWDFFSDDGNSQAYLTGDCLKLFGQIESTTSKMSLKLSNMGQQAGYFKVSSPVQIEVNDQILNAGAPIQISAISKL
jgi:alpha-glucosidase